MYKSIIREGDRLSSAGRTMETSHGYHIPILLSLKKPAAYAAGVRSIVTIYGAVKRRTRLINLAPLLYT